jgi:hypothetical protein
MSSLMTILSFFFLDRTNMLRSFASRKGFLTAAPTLREDQRLALRRHRLRRYHSSIEHNPVH